MNRNHLLKNKFPEIEDIPQDYKVVTYGQGSIMGEEDSLTREHFQCTVKCASAKASVYVIEKEAFL